MRLEAIGVRPEITPNELALHITYRFVRGKRRQSTNFSLAVLQQLPDEVGTLTLELCPKILSAKCSDDRSSRRWLTVLTKLRAADVLSKARLWRALGYDVYKFVGAAEGGPHPRSRAGSA